MAYVKSDNKFDPVQKSLVWEEACRREQRTLRLIEAFTVTDPRKMKVVVDKPNWTTPLEQPSREQLDSAHQTLMQLSNMKDFERLPTELYKLPRTSNMHYGFFNGGLAPAQPLLSTHTKGSTDVTRYGIAYTAMTGHTPFQQRKAVAAHSKPA